MSDDEKARLASRSIPEPNTGCWIWLAGMSDTGYGSLWFRGKTMGAHRASWLAHRGPIPGGMFVCHRCDNRWCINPDHLFLGTFDDNMADMKAKGRAARGVRARSAKLSPASIAEAARLRGLGLTYEAIGSRMGVCRHSISNALRGVTWRAA